jgi:NAD(P)-dependent dehydrogenase (short-subunit alcohol dehydrogenase family)
MRRPIGGSTIVVVGATSGVGKATALSLATHGANLVIVSRTADHVETVADACRLAGASAAIGVAADISKPDDVDRIVSEATARFGTIDTWINAAAALVVGEIHQQAVTDIEQLIATNVLGTTLASRAAMNHFRTRNAGVLINMSSLLGVVPNPIVPTYSMSKFAVRGLTPSVSTSRRGTAHPSTSAPSCPARSTRRCSPEPRTAPAGRSGRSRPRSRLTESPLRSSDRSGGRDANEPLASQARSSWSDCASCRDSPRPSSPKLPPDSSSNLWSRRRRAARWTPPTFRVLSAGAGDATESADRSATRSVGASPGRTWRAMARLVLRPSG